MDRAFTKHESQFLQESKASKKRFLDEHADDSDPIEGSPTARRLKLSDSLRDSQGQLGSDRSRDIKRVAQNARKLAEESVDSRKISKFHKDHSVHSDTDAGADIPIKPLGSIADPPERETRSSTRRATKKTRLLHGDPGPEEDAAKPLFKDDPFRENWKEPLVYPPDGKKKAEVNLGDRDRLRTDDFLNDNLIAFYMRFLQDHLERTNPETAKRIYFFNSYFFATLAKDARTRGINYTGVEKWTRNVDLFSYDYIVVPINESAHWYVAVICNLPSLSLDSGDSVDAAQTPTLEKEISNVSEDQVHQIQETPEPELRPESGNTSGGNPANSDGQLTRTQMESETQKDPSPTAAETGGDAAQDAQNSREPSAPGELTGYDDNPPPLANLSKSTAQKLAQEHAAASQFKNNLKKKRSGLKLDPNQTTIITFDSLDAARSPTIRLLREYTCLEAASKRGVQLDPSEIKGMRARGIPLQPNFWDCGLYLLAYLEKFVQSPDYFITKVLQRSLSTMEDWPPLGSGLLRDRFGKFLDELYIEQKSADVPIMVDSFPVSFLLGPPLPSQEEIPGLDMVPESQPETDISKADDATAAESVKYQMDDSIADQTHLAPIEQFRNSNENTSNPSLDAAQQDGAVSLTKEEPEIQVPGSQEEPRLPDTPPRKKKERKRQISRNSLKE